MPVIFPYAEELLVTTLQQKLSLRGHHPEQDPSAFAEGWSTFSDLTCADTPAAKHGACGKLT